MASRSFLAGKAVRLRGAAPRLRRISLRLNRGRRLVTRIFTNWNRLDSWLRQVQRLRGPLGRRLPSLTRYRQC